MMAAMLEIDSVSTAYDKADVLQGVSLTVQPGSITCLLGSNGSGKTTLVRSILGLTPRAPGASCSTAPISRGCRPIRSSLTGIACIPEGRKVFPKLTVEENLRLGAYQEKSDKATQARMADILQIFPRLAERRTQLAGTMSGGEQAMVSIGRGLMCAPKLLLIDEPSLGLSPLLVKENFNIIRQINERGITVLSGRAERAPDARHLAIRLCAVERPRGDQRGTIRDCGPQGGARCLFWLDHALLRSN